METPDQKKLIDTNILIEGRPYTQEEIIRLGPVVLDLVQKMKEEITKIIPEDQIRPSTEYLKLAREILIAAAKLELDKTEQKQ